jgi:CDP-diacylglycerol--glycerol-3-phosphate 3-phosphatidyltransferase
MRGAAVRRGVHPDRGTPVQPKERIPAAELRRRFSRGWAILAAVHAVILSTGVGLLWLLRGSGPARLWGIKVGAVLAFELLLPLARRRYVLDGENLQRMWGAANLLTLFRGLLVALLAGFLFAPRPEGAAAWLPALLFTTAAAVDFLDGWWARHTSSQTHLGSLLDMEFDAVGILLAVALTVQYRALPAPFLAVGVARYLFVAAAALRRRRGRPVHGLPPSYLRRRLAGFQMGVLAVILWPVAQPPATTIAEGLVGIPLLAGFLRDWLVVSGRLDPQDPGYRRVVSALRRAAYRWAPLALRTALVVAGVLAVGAFLRSGPAVPGPGNLAPALPWALLLALRLALIAALAAGWRTSPSALLLLLLEALRIFRSGADPAGLVVVACSLLLYVLGPGRFAAGPHSPQASDGPGRGGKARGGGEATGERKAPGGGP